MRRFFRQFLPEIALMLICILGLMFLWGCAHVSFADTATRTVYVTASELNGREEPVMGSSVEAHFYRGDELEALGYQCGWVEVVGGEPGTVWCKAEYLTEYDVDAVYQNTSGGRVFIHRELGDDDTNVSRVVENGKSATVTRVLFGYGYIGKGWIDLNFMELEDNDGA